MAEQTAMELVNLEGATNKVHYSAIPLGVEEEGSPSGDLDVPQAITDPKGHTHEDGETSTDHPSHPPIEVEGFPAAGANIEVGFEPPRGREEDGQVVSYDHEAALELGPAIQEEQEKSEDWLAEPSQLPTEEMQRETVGGVELPAVETTLQDSEILKAEDYDYDPDFDDTFLESAPEETTAETPSLEEPFDLKEEGQETKREETAEEFKPEHEARPLNGGTEESKAEASPEKDQHQLLPGSISHQQGSVDGGGGTIVEGQAQPGHSPHMTDTDVKPNVNLEIAVDTLPETPIWDPLREVVSSGYEEESRSRAPEQQSGSIDIGEKPDGKLEVFGRSENEEESIGHKLVGQKAETDVQVGVVSPDEPVFLSGELSIKPATEGRPLSRERTDESENKSKGFNDAGQRSQDDGREISPLGAVDAQVISTERNSERHTETEIQRDAIPSKGEERKKGEKEGEEKGGDNVGEFTGSEGDGQRKYEHDEQPEDSGLKSLHHSEKGAEQANLYLPEEPGRVNEEGKSAPSDKDYLLGRSEAHGEVPEAAGLEEEKPLVHGVDGSGGQLKREEDKEGSVFRTMHKEEMEPDNRSEHKGIDGMDLHAQTHVTGQRDIKGTLENPLRLESNEVKGNDDGKEAEKEEMSKIVCLANGRQGNEKEEQSEEIQWTHGEGQREEDREEMEQLLKSKKEDTPRSLEGGNERKEDNIAPEGARETEAIVQPVLGREAEERLGLSHTDPVNKEPDHNEEQVPLERTPQRRIGGPLHCKKRVETRGPRPLELTENLKKFSKKAVEEEFAHRYTEAEREQHDEAKRRQQEWKDSVDEARARRVQRKKELEVSERQTQEILLQKYRDAVEKHQQRLRTALDGKQNRMQAEAKERNLEDEKKERRSKKENTSVKAPLSERTLTPKERARTIFEALKAREDHNVIRNKVQSLAEEDLSAKTEDTGSSQKATEGSQKSQRHRGQEIFLTLHDKETGETLLHLAARRGYVDVLRVVMDGESSKRDAIDSTLSKASLLHEAARSGDVNVVKLLLSLGHKTTQEDFFGDTPLHVACRCGRANIIKVLIAADPSILKRRNKRGKLPQDLVQRQSTRERLQALQNLRQRPLKAH